MNDLIKIAEQQLLEPGGLDQGSLHRVLSDLMGPAVESGDIYFQSSAHESWMLEDGLTARFQIQLHKVIWGADTPGV